MVMPTTEVTITLQSLIGIRENRINNFQKYWKLRKGYQKMQAFNAFYINEESFEESNEENS